MERGMYWLVCGVQTVTIANSSEVEYHKIAMKLHKNLVWSSVSVFPMMCVPV